MSYIDSNLLPEEQIIFRTRKHIIVFFYPVLWTAIAIAGAVYFNTNPVLAKLEWVPAAVALFFWLYVGIDYSTSEFAVTNKRIMMREGFFLRHSNETRLNTISQVNIDQSLLGRILNYGIVSINAFGAYDSFPTISRPYQFQQCVNVALDAVTR